MGSSGGNAVAGASSVDSSAITDGSVANADLANMANKTFKGRHTAGTGVPEDVSAANLKSDLAIAASDVSGFDTQVRTSRLDQMAAPGADVPFATHKITGLGDPTSAQDAASKSYVDGLINGLSPKASCRLASAAALPTNAYVAGVLTATAFGTLTVDGSVVAVGNRVLVKDEVAQANNGIYVVTATGGGAAFYILTRSTDMNTGAEVPGAYTLIEEGTANADSAWVVSGAGPYTIGVTAIPWVEFGGVFVSDTAYDATTWNGVTTIAPSKNAMRDKIESLSGASSTPFQLTGQGVYKDLDISGAASVVCDPRPTEWEADTTYTVYDIGDEAGPSEIVVPNFVHPVGDTSVSLKANLIRAGTSGASQPVFDVVDQSTDDGGMCWQAPLAYSGAWAAGHTYNGAFGDYVTGGGHLWLGDNGTSGGSPPNWASAPAVNDTVMDNGITWTNLGPYRGAWAALTEYGYTVAPDGGSVVADAVTPTPDNGFVYRFNYAMARTAASGSDEPTWDTVADHYTLDGDVLWVVSTDPPALVITGIAAPADPAAVTIVNATPPNEAGKVTIVDQGDVATLYPTMASVAANRFDEDFTTINLDPSTYSVQVSTDRWRPAVAA